MGASGPSTITILTTAGLVGAVIGAGSIATTPQGRQAMAATAGQAAVASGLKRQREPQPGDHWGGCNDARLVGTAPIYRGEPGYSPEMDGDSDGIACESRRS